VLCAIVLGGCALSPGMHYGASAPSNGDVDTSATVNGLHVRLRSLTPAVAQELSRQSSTSRSLPAELAQPVHEPYRLGIYDVVTVAVWEHPELTMPLGQYRSDAATGQMVDESGNIFFPYAGMLQAKGLTTLDLRQKLLTSLSKVLTNPQLDVKVTGFRSQKVFVHGAVPRPGAVPVTDIPLSLLDAVNQAGGAIPSGGTDPGTAGDASHVELVRGGKTYSISLLADYGQGVDPSRLFLRDGDVVRVPTRGEEKVYVLGEVQKTQALALNNGRMSLAQALAEGGGLNPLSAQGKGVYVVRLHDSTSMDVFHLDASNPLALVLGDRFPLQPHDLVWVDASGLARWNRVITLLAPTGALYNNLVQGVYYTKTDVKDQ
jgi:polysaccharide export outer membrane protein